MSTEALFHEASDDYYANLQLGLDSQFQQVLEADPQLAGFAIRQALLTMEGFALDTEVGSQHTRLQFEQVADAKDMLTKFFVQFTVYHAEHEAYEGPSPLLLRGMILPRCMQRAGSAEQFEPTLRTFVLDMVARREATGLKNAKLGPTELVERLSRLVLT